MEGSGGDSVGDSGGGSGGGNMLFGALSPRSLQLTSPSGNGGGTPLSVFSPLGAGGVGNGSDAVSGARECQREGASGGGPSVGAADAAGALEGRRVRGYSGGSAAATPAANSVTRASSSPSVVQLELVLEQDSVSAEGQTVVNRASITFDFDRQGAEGAATARELVSHLVSVQSLRVEDHQLVPFLAALLETQRFAFRVSISSAVEGTRLVLGPA